MILKREIEKHAEKEGVPKTTIDKDWVLGHFLDAIYSIPECREQLIFKGGTCLRKCYFPDYRFSEDLDFTSTNPGFTFNKKMLNQITGLVTERTELPLYILGLTPLHFQDRLTGYEATIKFWGADHPRNQPPPQPQRWTSSIKLEIILYEQMYFPSEERKVHHPYSDQLSQKSITVPCYTLQEVLAEKLRSLIQRSYTAPRDFYDIWYLSQNVDNLKWPEIIKAFHAKMAFKKFEFTGIDQMINPDNNIRLKNAWESNLGHQIPGRKLPAFEKLRSDIQELIEKYLVNTKS